MKMIGKIKKEYSRFIKKQYNKLFGNFEPTIGHNVWSDLWKEYYYQNYSLINDKIIALKANLDKESRETVDKIFERYVFLLPLQKYKTSYIYKVNDFFSQEELSEQKKITFIDETNYKLPQGIYYEDSIFRYGHGIKLLPKNTLEYLKDKDIIDGGAFVGDSAIVFNNYTDKNIYSFEPDTGNFNKLQETINLNNLKNKIIPINLGLSDKNEEIKLYSTEFCQSVLVVTPEKLLNPTIIKTTSIDDFVEKNNLNPGLIKLDVEGNELEVINGALNTIKKFKPVLLISIYHHPKDFFNIKPLIENLSLNYKFQIKKLNPFSPVYETMLIAFPEDV